MNRLQRIYQDFSEQMVLVFIVIGVFVVMSIVSPYFFTVMNLTNIIQYVSTYGIVSIGMTMVILTGGINLSVGGTVAISSYIGAMAMLSGVPWQIAVIMIVTVGIVIGIINGLAVTVLGIPPLIATLAMEQITRGLHLAFAQGAPLSKFPAGFLAIGASVQFGVPMAVWWTILLFIAFGIFLHKTKIGRNIYAVGGNPMATRVAGVNNTKVIVLVYALAGILCSIAGIVVVGRMNSVAVSISKGLDMQTITACVLGGASVTVGGKGKILGTFLGVFIMGLLQNSLDLLNVSAYWQTFIQGTVLFLAVSIDAIRAIRSGKTSTKVLKKRLLSARLRSHLTGGKVKS